MRKSLALLTVLLALGAAVSGCTYAPVPGAENDRTYSPIASAGGR